MTEQLSAFDYHGGVTAGLSAVKAGLLTAIEIGLIDKDKAVEINQLVRDALRSIEREMTND